MVDAKSRYEIIDELTNKKSDLMDQKTDLDDNVLQREQNIELKKRQHERKLEQLKREHEENIEDMEAGLKSYKQSVENRKGILNEKIAAHEEAINAIKSISEAQNS